MLSGASIVYPKIDYGLRFIFDYQVLGPNPGKRTRLRRRKRKKRRKDFSTKNLERKKEKRPRMNFIYYIYNI